MEIKKSASRTILSRSPFFTLDPDRRGSELVESD